MPDHEHFAHLLIGSNIEPERNVRQALLELCHFGILQKVSRGWQTPPFGSQGPDFINLAVELVTFLPLGELKNHAVADIEEKLGRVRVEDKNAPRTIDIDIILYDGVLLDETLWSRVHTAITVADLLPDLVQESTGRRLIDIAHALQSSQPLRERPDIFA